MTRETPLLGVHSAGSWQILGGFSAVLGGSVQEPVQCSLFMAFQFRFWSFARRGLLICDVKASKNGRETAHREPKRSKVSKRCPKGRQKAPRDAERSNFTRFGIPVGPGRLLEFTVGTEGRPEILKYEVGGKMGSVLVVLLLFGSMVGVQKRAKMVSKPIQKSIQCLNRFWKQCGF